MKERCKHYVREEDLCDEDTEPCSYPACDSYEPRTDKEEQEYRKRLQILLCERCRIL